MKIVLAFIFACLLWTGVSAQEQTFVSLAGKSLTHDEIIASPKTVLFIWALWCPYCLKEFERLSSVCEYAEGVKLYFINTGDAPQTLEEFARKKKLSDCARENIIIDPKSVFADEFSVVGIPTFIFLRDGKIVSQSYYLDRDLLRKNFAE